MPPLVQDDVVWLDVPVDDAPGGQVVQGQPDLGHEEADLGLAQRAVTAVQVEPANGRRILEYLTC